jgi:hypothetical protein
MKSYISIAGAMLVGTVVSKKTLTRADLAKMAYYGVSARAPMHAAAVKHHY